MILSLVACEASAAAAPTDPFAAEYLPPKATEVGTTAGQLRLLGSAGGTIGRGLGLAAQGTMEYMTLAWLGVRGSGLATLPLADDPQITAARLGPSLHLLPYRRVDVGAFFEGGAGLVDLAERSRAWMPILAAGGTIDVALTSFAVLHLEGLVQVGVADRDGRADTILTPVGLLGLGLMP